MENLCQFGPGCFGCCGHTFGSKEEIEKDIEENIKEFTKMVKTYNKKDLVKFMDRKEPFDLNKSGVCRNLLPLNGKLGCPLHPSIVGEDLRRGHCDIDYFCESFVEFVKWDEKKRKAFLDFLKDKNPDWYEYSIKIENSDFLKEFNAIYKEKKK